MAHVTFGRDTRGVVYVEFLLAFFPVFLLFLGICQLALIGTAAAVVRHAAYSAARAAIVVLEEAPSFYDGEQGGPARGDVTHGAPPSASGIGALLAAAGLPAAMPALDAGGASAPAHDPAVAQQGARMAPIRSAAYMPLVIVAPRSGPHGGSPDSLAGSLPSELALGLGAALAYTESATVVTLHTRTGTETLATEPIPRTAAVTVRVSYLFQCSIPLVRSLLCRSLKALTEPADPASEAGKQATELAARMRLAEAPGGLAALAGPDALFYVLRGEVTLPNQGAAYEHPEGS